MSYTTRARDGEAPTPRTTFGIYCERCTQQVSTRFLRGDVWLGPCCLPISDRDLESSGQLSFAPDVSVEDAA